MGNLLDSMTDEQLASQAQNGSDQAAGCLIARYLPMAAARAVGFFGPGLEQDDLVQEGLLGLWSAVKSFDPQRGASFSTFASQCVGQAMQLPDRDDPEAAFIEKESQQLRSRKMQRLLSPREWAVLERYLKGESYQEISEHLGISAKAVDNALQRVRRKLQNG